MSADLARVFIEWRDSITGNGLTGEFMCPLANRWYQAAVWPSGQGFAFVILQYTNGTCQVFDKKIIGEAVSIEAAKHLAEHAVKNAMTSVILRSQVMQRQVKRAVAEETKQDKPKTGKDTRRPGKS